MCPVRPGQPSDDELGSDVMTMFRHPTHDGALRDGMDPSATLPDFVVIGAMRSGTTSLARFLRARPDVGMSPVKELHFFDRNYHMGLDWYAQQFSDTSGAIRGEATPNYMYRSEVAHRIRSCLPSAKLVAILREPVARAYSHYWHRVARGAESLSFEDAVRAEPARLGRSTCRRPEHIAYVDRSRYGAQLRRFYDLFPAAQIRVLVLEEVDRDPAAQLGDLLTWLSDGACDASVTATDWPLRDNQYTRFRFLRLREMLRILPPWLQRLLGTSNVVRSRYPPMPSGVRSYVADQLAGDRVTLERLLGRRIECWPHRRSSMVRGS